jgi:3-isopropylmalate/(R)-2-methylmalate dehydratase small subunit
VTLSPFEPVRGPAVPLLRANIDTDVIIRIERLTGGDRATLGDHALEALRFLPDGTPDPSAPFNQPRFTGAPILVAGRNFGCGSSREGAVWALWQMGLRAVIAPSFGDIFFANCFQSGLLPIRLPEPTVERIAAVADSGASLAIDLRGCTITLPHGAVIAFTIDPARREALLAGLDDVGLTLRDAETIAQWQRADAAARPWVWALADHG